MIVALWIAEALILCACAAVLFVQRRRICQARVRLKRLRIEREDWRRYANRTARRLVRALDELDTLKADQAFWDIVDREWSE
jgi:hypothetical protein